MDSHVVVFPSAFVGNITLLGSNVKKILDIKGLSYDKIWRDGQVIVVDARDPVFASSAIGLLYGIEKVAIARRVESNFEDTVKEISKIGSSLLLKGDRFFIKVEGAIRGVTISDLELAATSAVIKASSSSGAVPGTINDHNRLLYTYMTKANSYVCIFLDKGLGGLPYGIHKGSVLCCIYDEISAVACLEIIKCGFEVKIIICYKDGVSLRKIAKITDRILGRLVLSKYILEFYKLDKVTVANLPHVASSITRHVAKKSNISRICVPVTPIVFSATQVDLLIRDTVKDGLVPYTPLGGLEKELYVNAKELGIAKFSPTSRMQKTLPAKDLVARIAKIAVANRMEITVKKSVNGMHNILDTLKEKQG